ncbi:MAG: hypothetical protein CL943_00530 [Candidatus Diapherotrites archaeon]|uniref:Glycosyl transferase family 1 domain-containing protein n=1 Tax=Candidatus Iainarchaeum sp. TaxID=3101447 RepID=A0A2D6M028_9ARCH|nr:hypothetical protein [Candidatus Diapherotrites archaeon]
MKKLKVLFNTSKGSFDNQGGGEIQLLETKAGLEKLGHSVKIFEQENYSVDIGNFDIFHNFNIHRDNYGFVAEAKAKGVPVAISTIYWSALGRALSWNTSISDKLKLVGVELINRFDFANLSKVRKMVQMVDVLLPNSVAEAMQLEKIFGVDKNKIKVVHNGVEERFAKASPKLFEENHDLGSFALYVGRIEERKNVLKLINSFNSLERKEKLVIIGSAAEKDQQYFEKCRRTAGANVLFLPPLPHNSKMLESIYAACKVFCLPSWYETPGLAALEAGLAGANLVVTSEGCTREYFGEHALYANPADSKDIAEKIKIGLDKAKGKALSNHIQENFLWKNAALETVEAYAGVVK